MSGAASWSTAERAVPGAWRWGRIFVRVMLNETNIEADCQPRQALDGTANIATIRTAVAACDLKSREHATGSAALRAPLDDQPVTERTPRRSPNLKRHRDGRVAVAAVVSVATIALLVGLGVGTNREATSASIDAGTARTADAPAAATSTAIPLISSDGVRSLSDSAACWWFLGGRVLSRSGILDSPDLSGRAAWSPAGVASYNDRPLRLARVVRMKVTAYSPDERSCGASADGITASGYSVFANGGCMVAADPRILPLGSLVSVPGYDGGAVVPVLDTGGAIKGNRLDVLYSTHERAVAWGVQELDVCVWEYADGRPNDFRRVRRSPK